MASALHGPCGTRGATWLQAIARRDRQIPRMGTGLVVLIAENDRDMRGYVRRCIETHGMKLEAIIEASDGQEALEIARGRRIDLLVSDGAMPRLDGFALSAALRREATDHRTRVLLITGQFDPRDAERRARAAGADGLLLKPFNALGLCEKIDEVMMSRSPASESEMKQS
ncbi:MAG: response regulator [Myxococcales bacterium]